VIGVLEDGIWDVLYHHWQKCQLENGFVFNAQKKKEKKKG
jgi:hypothetical protein